MIKKSEIVKLSVDEETEILAEVSCLGGEEDVALSLPDIEGAMSAIKGIASRLHEVLEEVRPQKAEVEFGVKLAASSGKVTGLLVEASGDASFKIKLVWDEIIINKK